MAASGGVFKVIKNCHSLVLLASTLFYDRDGQGVVFKVVTNDNFIVFLAV